MARLRFEGAILNNFDNILDGKFEAETVAVSERKAKSNIQYQAKKHCGLLPTAKIKLKGKWILLDE